MRKALLLALALTACSHAGLRDAGVVGTITYSQEDLDAQARFAEAVKARDDAAAAQLEADARQRRLAEMAELSTSPAVVLKQLALAHLRPQSMLDRLTLGFSYTTDGLMRGSVPTTTQQFPCSTGTTTATWQSTQTCWQLIELKQPAAGTNGVHYWAGYPDNTGTNYLGYFLDLNSGMFGYFGGPLQLVAYHGIYIDTNEAGTIPTIPGSVENFVVTLHNASAAINFTAGSSSGTFNVTAPGGIKLGANSTAITMILKQSPSLTFSIGAQSCGDLSPGTVTNVVLGGACFISAYDTSGAVNGLVSMQCGARGSASVGIRVCNPSTGTISVTSKVYAYYVVQ